MMMQWGVGWHIVLRPLYYVGIQFNCIINSLWLYCKCHTIMHRQPLCPLPRWCAWLFTKIKPVTVKIGDKLESQPSLSLCLSPYATPSLTVWFIVDSMHTNVHLFMYIIIICIPTDDRQKKKKAKSNHNLLSLFFMMWLAWIAVPLAPILFPRMQHTGNIVQLTKWPLNHVILLSVHHWQK